MLDRSFLPGATAVMIPRTDDGRVLFAIPWLDRVLIGTTDTSMAVLPKEPRPLEMELTFCWTTRDGIWIRLRTAPTSRAFSPACVR